MEINDLRPAAHRSVFASPFWWGRRRGGPVILLTGEGSGRFRLHKVRPSRRRRGRCYLRCHAESGGLRTGRIEATTLKGKAKKGHEVVAAGPVRSGGRVETRWNDMGYTTMGTWVLRQGSKTLNLDSPTTQYPLPSCRPAQCDQFTRDSEELGDCHDYCGSSVRLPTA